MPQQPNPASANVIFFVMLFSAAMLAMLGTVLPGMLEFDDGLGQVLRYVLYAAAIGDLVIAFWLRNKIRKAASSAQSSGTIQRQ